MATLLPGIFKRTGKVFVWITECRTKAYKSSETIMRREHKEEIWYNIAMGLAMLDSLFFIPVLLRLPGSKQVYHCHFHDSSLSV